MKRKQILCAALGVVFLTGIGVFAGHSETVSLFLKNNSIVKEDDSNLNSKASSATRELIAGKEPAETTIPNSYDPGSSPKQVISDEMAFDMFFIKVISLENAAAKAEAKGESGKIWRNYLQHQGFTGNEVTVIRQVAKEHAAEIAPLHARALQIIRNGRAAIAQGKPLPPAPPELAELQKQRNAIAVRSKNKLQTQLGAETVERAKDLMRKNSNMLEIAPADLMNSEERINKFKQKMLNRKGGMTQ